MVHLKQLLKKLYEEKITFQNLTYKMLGFTWPLNIRSKHIDGVSNLMEIIGTQMDLKPRCDKPNNNRCITRPSTGRLISK